MLHRLAPTALLSVLFVLPPGAASAAETFTVQELGGCRIPVPTGSKRVSPDEPTLENGNLAYNVRDAQTMIVWFPGANRELTPETVGLYADALAKSGSWLGADQATWETVGDTKAARLPFKTRSDQPVQGLMLMWADVASGRYFMYALTPAWGKDDKAVISADKLGAWMTEAAGLVDCTGAEHVKDPLVLLDPLPEGYTGDTSDLPRLYYRRRAGGHVAVLWRAAEAKKGTSCLALAEPVFKAFVEADPGVSFAGEAAVAVDDIGGAEGGVRCDVSRPISGFSGKDGDLARYRAFPCPDGASGLATALEFVGGGLEGGVDVLTARCAEELPAAPAPEPTPAATPAEKRQWKPGGGK